MPVYYVSVTPSCGTWSYRIKASTPKKAEKIAIKMIMDSIKLSYLNFEVRSKISKDQDSPIDN